MPTPSKPSKATSQPGKKAAPAIKHPKPKILLLDVQDDVAPKLKAQGFNITEGTMGRPYSVPKSGGYQPLIGIAKADNLTEQEIVIVDLEIKSYLSAPEGYRHSPDGELDVYGKCDKGFLDPRARTAFSWLTDCNRIHANGGAFVIFADKRTNIDLQTGNVGRYNSFEPHESYFCDAWSFLIDLLEIEVQDDNGHEIKAISADSPLSALLARHLNDGYFTCTFAKSALNYDLWSVLATNKFGNAVALARCEGEKGTIIIIPHLKDKATFLSELITTVLPEICPHLFPFIEKGRWTHHSDYELPLVATLLSQQEQIRQTAAANIKALDAQIERERMANGWMHDLLTGTDTVLVEAVKKSLEVLGFEKVVDVDSEQDSAGKSRREDLQIKDTKPTLIVDIKGLGGFPSDSDANQSFKHATLRGREWKSFDVQALTLINHQRHLPPLDRDNDLPFRQELLDLANEHEMGLMTTWDLYRLLRGSVRWGWRPEHTKPVLYGLGRIDPVPTHYTYLGTVAHVYTVAVSIQIEAEGLRIGSRIAFELDNEFEEQEVTSLQVDKLDVQNADVGCRAGTQTELMRPALREGQRVFLVQTQSCAPEKSL